MHKTRDEGIFQVAREGHRSYVGGNDQYWDELGDLQFKFLLENKLTPKTVFLDIGCGSLRGGCRFIGFLDEANYLGIDKEISLLILGVAKELGVDRYLEKKPELVVSDSFEFEKFSKTPEMAIAQSLFTHLTLEDIGRCLGKLYQAVDSSFVLYGTYFPASAQMDNPQKSHSHACFYYTAEELQSVADAAGFEFRDIGDWNHPRGQFMASFTKK